MSTALDKRRINGPDRVFQPIFSRVDEVADAAGSGSGAGPSSSSTSSSSKGKDRVDRTNDQVRPIFLQTNLIPQANGSAYIECGSVKIACAVYGPRQQPRSNRSYRNQAELNVECRYTCFAGEKRRKPGKDLESSHLSSLIHNSLLPSIRLSLLPKSSLDVYLTIFECDAAASAHTVMPLGLTVASLALATAGIELWGLSVGCAIAVRGGDDGSDEQERDDDGERTTPTQYFVDPTRDEIAQARGVVSMCTMPALGSVTALEVAGSLDLQEINKAVEMLTQSSAQIHLLVAEALQEAAQSVVKQRQADL